MTQLQISRNHPSGHSRHTAHIPHTMPAAAIDHFGGPEVLTLHNVPVPSIDEKEVLIALDTAGVGPWDADIREGWYPSGKPRFPLVLGVDGAGVIAAVGSRFFRKFPAKFPAGRRVAPRWRRRIHPGSRH